MQAVVTDAVAGELELQWSPRTDVSSYRVSRLNPDGSLEPELVLAAGTQSLLVSGLQIGGTYEWRMRAILTDGKSAYGNLRGGIDVTLVEDRGRILVCVADGLSASLAPELDRLTADLVGDGWQPKIYDVPAGAQPVDLKAAIVAEHGLSPLSAVFLFGDLPVAYSGTIAPDGHSNHYGAWPADGYYGDMDGVWTDTLSNSTSASSSRNHNVPGDGKFDQSLPPTPIDLMVGRVDLSHLPAFAPKTELDLLRQYLDKDHAFRHGQLQVPATALVDDHFSNFAEGLAASARSGFAATLGHAAVTNADWPDAAGAPSYLLGAGLGAGSYSSASGVGSAASFAAGNPNVVFSGLFGSYFGDWDTSNNFLRAPLACEGVALASAYVGRPQWHFHPLGLGLPIGETARLTQNAKPGSPYHTSFSGRSVHIALHGDPSLRMFPSAPATDVSVARTAAGAQISWTASTQTQDLLGYHVYRAETMGGDFSRITTGPISGSAFVDPLVPTGQAVYQVRAIHRKTTGSGSFINGSQGAFAALAALPVVSIEPALQWIEEGRDPAVVRITRTGPVDESLPISFGYSGSTGTMDVVDQVPSLVIPAGESELWVAYSALADGLSEGAEELLIDVTDDPVNYVTAAASTSCVTVYDSPYGQFASASFGHITGDITVAGPSADPDGDGFSNLVEFATGLSPMEYDGQPLRALGRHEQGGVHYRCYEYTQVTSPSGIEVIIECSEDLSQWAEPVGMTTTVVAQDNSSETLEVLVPEPASGRCFVRLTARLLEGT